MSSIIIDEFSFGSWGSVSNITSAHRMCKINSSLLNLVNV